MPLLVLCALGLALAVGRVLTPPTGADRVERIASQLRCPVCEGESVAESDAQASLAIRAEIASEVAAGLTDEEILRHFADEYGEWILLAPPGRGWLALAWIAPAAALLAGGAAAALWLRNASGRTVAGRAAAPHAPSEGASETEAGRNAPADSRAPLPARLRDYL